MNSRKSVRKCPQCASTVERESKNFPFCSDRCQSLDLGAWAAEKYRIAAHETDEDGAATDESTLEH